MKRRVSNSPFKAGATMLAAAGVALFLVGCVGSEAPPPSSEGDLATPAAIAQASADNYDDNVNGLITGNTLKQWIDNWPANRPAGVSGKLVILQASTGEAGYEYIKPNGSDVFTYVVSDEWKETRSNGVTETVSMVPSGRTMDTLLAKYNIDPANDMIVCAQGKAGGAIMTAGRCWYTFRYWGTSKQHLAMLDGGNQWNGQNTILDATYFAAAGSTPPMSGTASVKDLPEINFALQATLEDMMNAVPSQDLNLLGDGVFIWDARGNNLPTSVDSSAIPPDATHVPGYKGDSDEYSPNDDYDFRNGGATQGHPNGALLLAWTNLLNTAEGYTFKSKADIQAYLDGTTDGFVDSTLQGVGAGNAYQEGDTVYTYCETTFRAMVTGFATGAILGLPTRFYDGAMTEWHSMANVIASDGNAILPWDSPWRTDTPAFGMYRVAGDAANVAPRAIVNAYAATANAVINEDLAYKGISTDTASTGDDGGSSSSGGSALPPNPCGG